MPTFCTNVQPVVRLVLSCSKAESRRARASAQEIKVLALLVQVIGVMKLSLSREKMTILNGESRSAARERQISTHHSMPDPSLLGRITLRRLAKCTKVPAWTRLMASDKE
jgi:hypothetical protein